MKNQNLPNRKPTRLPNFDYSTNGMYFVTICTDNKKHLLCNIVGAGLCARPNIELTKIGSVVEQSINYIDKNISNYKNVHIINYVIMPNHIHILLFIDNPTGGGGTPPLPNIIGAIKSYTDSHYNGKLWQRSFFDHIIRDQADYENVYNYIDSNPSKWESDELYIKD